MKKTFKFLFIFIFLFMSACVFADDWYICLGSFKEKINAQSREQILNKNDFPSFVIEHTSKKGEKLFRVLLDEAIPTEKSAERRKNQLEKQLKDKKLNIQGLWYYQPYKSSLKKRVPPLSSTGTKNTEPLVNIPKTVEEPEVLEDKKPELELAPEEKAEVLEEPETKEKSEATVEPETTPVEKSESTVSNVITEEKSKEDVADEDLSAAIEGDETTETVEEPKETPEENPELVKSIEEELSAPDMPFKPIDFTKEIETLKKESKESSEEQLVPSKREILIKDSVSGYPVSNANVNIDDTWNTISNEKGMAKIPDEVPDGEHKIIITKEGEIVPVNSSVILENGEITSIAQISVPKYVDYERIQIILDWGELPYDLDSHILDSKNHVYFSNRDVNGELNLDRDDTTSYGPETITIYSPKSDEKYEYYVFNYSDQSFDGLSLSYSNARVRVIWNNTQIGEFYITPGIAGRTWHVFDIENGSELKIFDSIINWEPRRNVYYEDIDSSAFQWWIDTTEESDKNVEKDSVETDNSEISVSEKETEKTDSEILIVENEDNQESEQSVIEEKKEENDSDNVTVEEEKEKFIPEGDPIDVPAKDPYKESPEDLLKVYGTLE